MYHQATVNSLTFKYSFFCGTASNYHTIAKLWTRISPETEKPTPANTSDQSHLFS